MNVKQVNVKIAVAVDSKGVWCAYGASRSSESDAWDIILESVDPGEARYFLTATLELPEAKEVAAFVEQKGQEK